MGFFSKIFGGKKDTGELSTQEPEREEIEPVKQEKAVAEPLVEEDRVPEPEPKADHKPTVFGMPAPTFTPAADQAQSNDAPGAVVSGELPIASGEISMGESEVGSSGGADHAEAAGSMEIGGELTVGATSSGEIQLGEVSVAAPVIRQSEPEADDETAETAETGGEPATSAEEPATSAEEPAPATPASVAHLTDSGRLSGARPALLDEEEHADVDLFPKADKKDLRSSIDCGSCRHKLPVPYVGYPARITCPFCLNVNEYNM